MSRAVGSYLSYKYSGKQAASHGRSQYQQQDAFQGVPQGVSASHPAAAGMAPAARSPLSLWDWHPPLQTLKLNWEGIPSAAGDLG